jgi:SAM-dependent methyltransferase
MSPESPLGSVERYYSEKVTAHGPTAKGVDWNGPESQQLRFAQLLRITTAREPFSINDYGCGYGALVGYLLQEGNRFTYSGFDISAAMLAQARLAHRDAENCVFVDAERELSPANYTVASGIFNVKLETEPDDWTTHTLATLDRLHELSTDGFAFNMLTSYSDADRMRPDLYYGDPSFFFDHCKRRYSRHVALLHDYGLYEFTILVRMEPAP